MTIGIANKSDCVKTNCKIAIENGKISEKSVIPDGGWGWMVLFATVVMRMLISGVYVSFGLFINEFVTEFNSNQTVLAWLVSLNQAISLGVTPLASFLSKKFSHRLVSLIGSVIVTISLVIPYFCPKLWMIFLSTSILNGIGIGFIYLSSTVILTTYFEKHLSIILGIYSAGFGLASFSIVPLNSTLIKAVGWRLTMLIYGGLLSICILLSFTFKSIKPNKTEDIEDETKNSVSDKIISENEILFKFSESSHDNFNSESEAIEEDINNKCSSLLNAKTITENSSYLIIDMNDQQNTNLEYVRVPSLNTFNYPSKPTLNIDVESNETATKASGNEYLILCRNPIFILFLFSNFLMFSGHDTTYIYTKQKATEAGVSESKAMILVTLIGIGNVIGRLLFGYLGSLKRINVYCLYISCVIMTGGSVLFSRVASTYPLMVAYTCCFGIFIGGSITLNAFVLTVILDITQFSTGLALTCLIQALGYLGGAPLSGAIYDRTKSLNWSFLVSGFFLISSGLCLLLGLISKKVRKGQNL